MDESYGRREMDLEVEVKRMAESSESGNNGRLRSLTPHIGNLLDLLSQRIDGGA
jgi:hypothetical protein